jgi:integrase/recombinase XerD
MNTDELAALVPSWELHLRAERKSEGTMRTYLAGVDPYLSWCAQGGHEALSRASLQTWTMTFLDEGRSPATAKTRMQAVRHFARWLAEEGEVEANPFEKMRPPKTELPVVPVLSDDELRALIKACEPPVGSRSGLASLRHRRDEALIRLLIETGMRASECLALELGDVDLTEGTVLIRHAKNRRARRVAFGPQVARALDRYVRVRRLHALADSPRLWLGDRGRGFSYGGLDFMLKQRGEVAGVPNIHAHQLRHTSAARWLSKGGSETGAVAAHGWSSLAMLERYGRADRERRAVEEARALGLGDDL